MYYRYSTTYEWKFSIFLVSTLILLMLPVSVAWSFCGDRKIDAGETCDNGFPLIQPTCVFCSGGSSEDPSFCGDEHVDYLKGEECEPPSEVCSCGPPGEVCSCCNSLCQYTEPRAGEGCSVALWRQNLSSWPGEMKPEHQFNMYFAGDAFPGMTLYEVLYLRGEGLNALGPQAVAAFLNAVTRIYDNDFSFALSVIQVREKFSNADVEGLRDVNELFCPLGDLLDNEAPFADAGVDLHLMCEDLVDMQVMLDGSGSYDPDGEKLTYTWTGPFGEADGVAPVVTLPIGRSTIELVVTDENGQSSLPSHVTVEIVPTKVTLEPLGELTSENAIAKLCDPENHEFPESCALPLPSGPFNQGRNIHLRLQLYCGSTVVTDMIAASPQIVDKGALLKGVPFGLRGVDLATGPGSNLLFKFSGKSWASNLSTQDLGIGTYHFLFNIGNLFYLGGFDLENLE